MYKVLLQRQAERYYKRADRDTAERLERTFYSLEKNPFLRVVPLKGEFKGLYRVRVGNLRIVLEVNKKLQIVNVLAILPRGDIYKKM